MGDLDGDGDLDVFAATGTRQAGSVGALPDRVLLNDGAGAFTDSGQRLGDAESTAVALGDLDGDGDLDALAGAPNGAVVWTNQGGQQRGQPGVFSAATQRLTGVATEQVFLQDLNGDGQVDALLAGKQEAAVWWNAGTGDLALSDLRFRYSEPHAVGVGDFDGDGRPDIVAADGRNYRLWANRGDGTFERRN
jgi:hypothetical protein